MARPRERTGEDSTTRRESTSSDEVRERQLASIHSICFTTPMPVRHISGGGGLRLAVHEFGPPEGKPIVLIPGINQCSLAWLKQYRSALAEEFRLVCLDLRGHGMSEKPTA